jgi:RHS repeat-associated protein
MTRTLKPADENTHYNLIYDAWNRLVKVLDGPMPIAEYTYDGRSFRTMKTAAGTSRHYYHSRDWQVLEERVGSSIAADRQFAWGLRYIDDLVLRDRSGSTPSDGTGEERLYTLHDSSWNVVAVTDRAGSTQERYGYSVYGRITALSATYLSRGDSAIDWHNLYTGREMLAETGIYCYRARYYNPIIGRLNSRDPIGYGSGDWNLYRYVFNRPVGNTDPKGLSAVACVLPIAGGAAACDGPIPIGDIIAVCLLGIAAIVDVCTPKECPRKIDTTCPPCPLPPAPTFRFDRVPPSTPHHPCKGNHTHIYWWETNQTPYPACVCHHNKREHVTCH